MSPEEEAASLKEFPMPLEVAGEIISPEDRILPTRIAAIDNEIKELEEKLKDLRSSRVLLLDHAVHFGVLEDPRFKIETETKLGNRKLDLEAVAKEWPKQYKTYIKEVKQKLKSDYDVEVNHIEKTVLLGIADKVFGENTVNLFSTREGKINYKVVKKPCTSTPSQLPEQTTK